MLLFHRDRRSGVGRRTSSRRQFVAALEGMEGRQLMTGSGALIFLSGTTLEVIGTSLGDTGSVGLNKGSVEVQVSNSAGSDDIFFPASQVGEIDYFGGTGSNTFANNTPITGYLFGGPGDNVLTGGSGQDFLIANGGGTNVLNAGTGSEVLERLAPATTP